VNEEPDLHGIDLKPCPFCGGEADVSEGTMGSGERLRPWWYIEWLPVLGHMRER